MNALLNNRLAEQVSQSPYPCVHLAPGEVLISRGELLVATILGSCVAVVLRAGEPRLSAICHAVLPGLRHSAAAGERLRYMDEAVCEMLEAFDRADLPRDLIEAKIFGGARVLATDDRSHSPFAVGARNVQRAEELLRSSGVRVTSRCVGGTVGRKLIFNTSTGDVFVRPVGVPGA